MLRVWADEDDSSLGTATRKLGVLRQKPVARVNRIHLVLPGQSNDVVNVEIRANGCLPAADKVGLVGAIAMRRKHVLFAVDSDGLFAELGAGLKDANSYLTAIRGEYSLKCSSW